MTLNQFAASHIARKSCTWKETDDCIPKIYRKEIARQLAAMGAAKVATGTGVIYIARRIEEIEYPAQVVEKRAIARQP